MIVVALVLAVHSLASTEASTDHDVHPVALCGGHDHRHGAFQFSKLARRAWAKDRWRRGKDPRRGSERRRMRHYRRCARTESAQRSMLRNAKRERRQFKAHRRAKLRQRAEQRSIRPYRGPYGRRWVIPWRVVACESGGNFRARNRVSSAGGAYQIINSTWYAYGGSRYRDSHPAAVASKREQHRVAYRVLRGQGLRAWECA